MQHPQPDAPDVPPDWPGSTVELTCPLCGYDLRGLSTPRCPECGFAFTWAELLDAKRDRHPWLFEHAARGRKVKSFLATYGRTCSPRRFWRNVTPANPVRRRPLLSYWIATTLLLAGVIVGPLLVQAGRLALEYQQIRSQLRPVPGQTHLYTRVGYGRLVGTAAEVDAHWPRPWTPAFARDVADAYLQRTGGAFVAVVVVTSAWPWLTVLALLVFQSSMRRAKTDVGHVLRAAVYGCDFGLLMMAATIAVFWLMADANGRPRARQVAELAAVLAMLTAAVCVAVTTYRLTIAYARYLRFHLPLATVVASQVIVFLAVLVVAVYATQSW